MALAAGDFQGTEAQNVQTILRRSFDCAQLSVTKLRHRSTRLVYVGVVAAALSTAIGANAATRGPLKGQGPGAWKLTCAVSAVLSACAAIAVGLNQQMGLADRLARAMMCAGRLRALEVQISMGGRASTEVAREYEELLGNYQEFMA